MTNTDALRPLEAGAKPGVEDTRLRILAATRALYACKGSRGTTTREVADGANVNEATLFRHFGTKQQLIAAMLEHYSAAVDLPGLIERLGDVPTIEEQLRIIAASSIESMKRNQDLIKVSMAEELANPDGSNCAWRAPAQARRHLTKFFEEKVSGGELRGDAEWLSRVFLSLLFAFVMARKIWADANLSPEVAAKNMVEIFLNGARPR
ncbi:MAG: TetR/AcrR family transcriptional regulator [Candidatus Eremiobacteraeota bacterium]|nr:TetR/AcrR family transcriptional regulator [Candidatus Eremiobacteraeota bacterium]